MAADYTAMIETELVPPIDVIGVSTGGTVALQLAADGPDLLRRLVIYSRRRDAQHRIQTAVGRVPTRVMAKSSTESSTPRSTIRPRLSLAMSLGKSSAEMTAADARNWR